MSKNKKEIATKVIEGVGIVALALLGCSVATKNNSNSTTYSPINDTIRKNGYGDLMDHNIIKSAEGWN